MPDLTRDELTLALAILAGVVFFGILLLLVLALRLKKVRREYVLLRGDGEEKDIIAAVARALRRVDAIDKRVDGVVTSLQENAATGRYALQRFGIVRYDAFEEMGGRLSFSAALLDDHGDGVLITSINGRTETRTYAKAVKQLTSEHNLSEEEREAIAAAMAGYGRGESRAEISR
ncbi:MAG: DUF4446 family protein [Actinomycetota bacterium]|nr:DUF4446 family protein [Actinomycetota bacterium]